MSYFQQTQRSSIWPAVYHPEPWMPRCIKEAGLFGFTAWMGRPPRTISVVSMFQEVMFFLLSPCVICLMTLKSFMGSKSHSPHYFWSGCKFYSICNDFSKGCLCSSDNGTLWPYLLKRCLCSACISFENLVTYSVSCYEFFGQSDSEGYEMFQEKL